MSIQGIGIISSLTLIGFTALFVGGSFLGETVATMAPPFPLRAGSIAEGLGLTFETVEFVTADGRNLRGWFFPLEDSNAPAILYAPGTAKDQRSGLSLVKPLNEAGFQVLLFSYRGHGESDGTRFGFTYGAKESEDVDAAVRYLHQQRGIQKIGAIGHSAGAVSIILSAARSAEIDAVVAASPFASLEEVWKTNRPMIFPDFLMDAIMESSEQLRGYSREQVRALDAIGKLSPRPLLYIHGDQDKRISTEQAYRLFEAAEGPKELWLLENADHGEVHAVGFEQLMPEIVFFLDRALK
jgi:dipeptidyl aminopeptidase/acylaminoacyl peptidase